MRYREIFQESVNDNHEPSDKTGREGKRLGRVTGYQKDRGEVDSPK